MPMPLTMRLRGLRPNENLIPPLRPKAKPRNWKEMPNPAFEWPAEASALHINVRGKAHT